MAQNQRPNALDQTKAGTDLTYSRTGAPLLFDAGFESSADSNVVETAATDLPPRPGFTGDQTDAIKRLAGHLLDLREMLKSSRISSRIGQRD